MGSCAAKPEEKAPALATYFYVLEKFTNEKAALAGKGDTDLVEMEQTRLKAHAELAKLADAAFAEFDKTGTGQMDQKASATFFKTYVKLFAIFAEKTGAAMVEGQLQGQLEVVDEWAIKRANKLAGAKEWGHPIPHIQKEVERDCTEREKKGAHNIPIHQQNASMPDSREWIKQGMDAAEWGKQCVQKAMRRQLQEAKEKTREKIADYQKNKDTRDKAGFEVLDNLDGKGDGRIEADQVSRALTPETREWYEFHTALRLGKSQAEIQKEKELLAATSITSFEEKTRKSFDRIDTDHSGTLDMQEISVALLQMGESKTEVAKKVAMIAKDEINYEEFKSLIELFFPSLAGGTY